MDVFDLVAKITLDSSEYESGLSDAEQKANGFGGKLKSGLGTAAKIGAGAIALVGTASMATGAAFVKGASNVATYGDNIDKMSQKMGMSSDAYQEWDAVMRHSGTSMETMKASMKTLANAAETGSEAFDKLGISQQDIANMSQEELFEATITALQGVEDETERTYLAGKTLGRGATELGALLNTSAEDTAKMRKRVHELGGVMDKRGVKASARYQDSLQDMQTAMQGLSRNLMTDMLPSMSTVMDGITEIFSGDSNKGIGMVTQGIDSLVGKIGQKIPKILEIGGKLLSSFGKVISENLPKVIDAAVQFVTANLPGAIKGLLTIAVPALVSLIGSVAKSLPSLLKGIFTAITESISQFMPSIKENGGKLLSSIGEGIKGAVSKIPEAIGGILTSIGSWVSENAGTLLEKGEEIFSNVISGISSAIGTIGETLAGIATAIGSWVTEHGGELLAAGQNLLNWVISGIKTFISNIPDAIAGIITAITGWVSSHSSDLLAAGQTILSWVVAGIKKWIENIKNGFSDAVSKITEWVTSVGESLLAVGQNILGWIVAGIKKWIEDIKDGFDNTVSKIKEKIDSLDFGAIGLQIIKKIKEAIGKWLSGIGAGLMGLPGKLVSYVRSNLSFESVGNAIVNGIKKSFTGISGLAEKLIGLIQGEVNKAGAHNYTTSVHVTASGQSAGGGGGSFAKAMHKPYLFNKSTVFGKYQGEDLIAGEAGPEMLLGVNKLNAMLYESVQGGMQSTMGQMYQMMQGMNSNNGGSAMLEQQILSVLQSYLPQLLNKQLVLDTGALAGAVAPGVDAALGGVDSHKRRYAAG